MFIKDQRCKSVHSDYTYGHMTTIRSDLRCCAVDRKQEKLIHVQLTLEPPPTHCPDGTIGARPPRAALSRAGWNLIVVVSGRRMVEELRKRPDYELSHLLSVQEVRAVHVACGRI